MTAPPPSRPWWKRKRTWAAVAVWMLLPVPYLAGFGPASYANIRGWVSDRTIAVVYAPLRWDNEAVTRRLPGWYADYLAEWRYRGTIDAYDDAIRRMKDELDARPAASD